MSANSAASREFDFDEWLEAGTVAQRTVELHNDRAIPDRLAALDQRRRIAAKVADDVEASVTEVPELAQIDAAIDELYAAWEASKETWVVRALSRDEIDWLAKRYPAPKQPKAPGKNSPPAAMTAFEQKAQDWAEKAAQVRDDVNLAYLSAAIVRFETSRGSREARGNILDGDAFVPAITADQLRSLRDRPGRQGDITLLMTAANDALKSDVEVPAPFSHGTSRTAQS